MQIQLAILLSVCRSSSCGPTWSDAIVFHVQTCLARTRNLLHFTKAKVSHTTMIAEPSNSKLGAVPVCVCPALYQRVSHDLTQNAGASGPSYLPDATKLWYDGGRVNWSFTCTCTAKLLSKLFVSGCLGSRCCRVAAIWTRSWNQELNCVTVLLTSWSLAF